MKIILILFLFFTIKIQAQVIPVAFMKSSISFDYPTVDIGGQQWMTYNLDGVNYRNGDPIPQETDQTTWKNLTSGAWCYYNNDAANGAIYGKLYNWYAVNDPRGLAPAGSHIPSLNELTILITYLGGESIAGGKLKSSGTTYWQSPNSGATNVTGFTGLPGGMRNLDDGFTSLNLTGWFWTATPSTNHPNQAHMAYIRHNVSSISPNTVVRPFINGLSVRVIKN
jgi:uncharacterized protein (TIGR02145 family)